MNNGHIYAVKSNGEYIEVATTAKSAKQYATTHGFESVYLRNPSTGKIWAIWHKTGKKWVQA